MAPTLETVAQTDFSAGAFPLWARDQIPRNGVEDAINCLIRDDGLLYRRGGSLAKSAASGGDGRWIWDGTLGTLQRTIMQAGGLWCLRPDDDATLVHPFVPGTFNMGDRKPAAFKGILAMPGGWQWGGYVPYGLAGNIPTGGAALTFTNGSTTVVGSGFTAGDAPAGQIVFFGGAAARYYAVVRTVTDATHFELMQPWEGPTGVVAATDWGITAGGSFASVVPAGDHSVSGWNIFAAVGNRLLASPGGGGPLSGGLPIEPQNRIYESELGNAAQVRANNWWELPAGAAVLGIERARDTAVVFSTAGAWAIYNVPLDLTDDAGNEQQRLEEISSDLILWSWAGVAAAHRGMIVPALDGIYLFNPTSGAVPISGGIGPLYRSYVEAGYHAGHAVVFGNTYLLPIRWTETVGGGTQVEHTVDVLACRLVPTERGRGVAYGWTRLGGYGGLCASFAVRSRGTAPSLLGVTADDGRIITARYINETQATDADGSSHQAQIVTREPNVGNGVKNFWQKVKMRYELTNAAGVSTVTAEWAEDESAYVALADTAPEATLTSPKTWQLRKRGFGKRLRLTSTGSATRFVLHALEWFVRPSGRQ